MINLLHAQERGRFRTGLDIGYATGSGTSAGFLFAVEPKYNVKDNFNVGLRFELAGIAKDFRNTDSQNNNSEGNVQVNLSFLAVGDYYFHKDVKSSFAPFVGGGFGLQQVSNVYFSPDQVNNNETIQNLQSNIVFAGMIRGGFEWSKFRLTAEYNFIPQTDLQDTSGYVIGKVNNNYFGLSVGFYLGGGKWYK